MNKKNIFRMNLLKRRKELGLTQEMLAQRLNVSPQAVSKWENSSYPDPDLLPLLSKALGVSIDSLFGIKGGDTDKDSDLIQMLHDRLQSISAEKRTEYLMKLFYAVIYSYNPTFHSAGALHDNYDKETFAGVKTDYDTALARLNQDLRYFIYLEKPENGVNTYFTNPKNMARLFKTLSSEEAIRIISYLGSGRRNIMHSASVISKRLSIPVEKVEYVMNRLDRLGVIWRVAFDSEDGETFMYGFSHNQALTMILILAESICNYFKAWDPEYDDFLYGMFKDETGRIKKEITEATWWNEDET